MIRRDFSVLRGEGRSDDASKNLGVTGKGERSRSGLESMRFADDLSFQRRKKGSLEKYLVCLALLIRPKMAGNSTFAARKR